MVYYLRFGMMELKKQEDVEKFMSLCGQEIGGREVKFEEIKESNIDGLTARKLNKHV